MTPEEFEKIKEAEKAHLRKVRKLKNAVRQLERQKKISGALNEMTSSMQERFDDHDQMMDRVAIDAALNEARLEIALEASEEAERKAQAAQDEADLAKARARQVMDELKNADPEVEADPTTESPTRVRERTESPPRKDDLPEKTIGRMKP